MENHETNYEYADNETEAQQESIKVVLVKPMKRPEIAVIDTDLDSLQNTVGGLIEAVYPYDEEVCIVCNEEGKNLRLPLNRALKDQDGQITDIIAGDFFICDCTSENFGSLSDEQLKRYSDMFEKPERFYKIDGEIKAVQISTPMQKEYER